MERKRLPRASTIPRSESLHVKDNVMNKFDSNGQWWSLTRQRMPPFCNLEQMNIAAILLTLDNCQLIWQERYYCD